MMFHLYIFITKQNKTKQNKIKGKEREKKLNDTSFKVVHFFLKWPNK